LERVVPGLFALWDFVGYLGLAWVVLAILGIRRLNDPETRFIRIALGGFLAYVVWAGGDVLHIRFFVHVLPLLAVAVAVGVDSALGRAAIVAKPGRIAVVTLSAVALAWCATTFEQDWRAFASIDQFGAGYVVNNSMAIQRANIPLGVWLRDHA